MDTPKQLDLFSNEAQQQGLHICNVSKSAFICIKDWITPDNRVAFIAGKEYKKWRSSKLSIVGENHIVIFISYDRLSEHFC